MTQHRNGKDNTMPHERGIHRIGGCMTSLQHGARDIEERISIDDSPEENPTAIAVNSMTEFIWSCPDRMAVKRILQLWLPFNPGEFEKLAHSHKAPFPAFRLAISQLCDRTVSTENIISGKASDGSDLVHLAIAKWIREQHRRHPQMAFDITEPQPKPHTGIPD